MADLQQAIGPAMSGDPYLPFIVCSECVEAHLDEAESEVVPT